MAVRLTPSVEVLPNSGTVIVNEFWSVWFLST